MLENRDYTLIIDHSASMAQLSEKGDKSRWLALQESTFALARKCEEFDTDGITVYLFSRKFERFDHVTSDKVIQIFEENIPDDTTNLVGVLQDAINNYFTRKAAGQSKPNGEIILVITDGRQDDKQAIYEVIINATHKMEHEKELGISIIQVGNDPQAKKFLKALDDQLQSVGAKFDICDTVAFDDLENMNLVDVLINAIND
ncbi:vWA domain-containing protein [Anabaena catenula]|uniref:VWA domain-containing protein n=1 Tax=Anabaena catenula FACHB-362 TaxID=2692877 RepID=A0ABR8J241_9NOST|nr:VWA domain-containing protein [Anabaena catenula]MBD2691723.1 VWA domain-containing protein [Anabaena catenula FACHB-362]